MIETINDRIETLINKLFNGNKAAFAKSIGLPPTGMSNYLGKQRRSKPSVDMIIKIVTLHNVDALWLLTGVESVKSEVKAVGDYSAASHAGNASVVVGDGILNERIAHLQELLAEKDERIKELKERIEDLKHGER